MNELLAPPASPPRAPSYPALLGARLRRLLWEECIKPVEFWLALRAIAWGGALLLPGEAFAATPQTHRAFLLVSHAEGAFGVPVLILGLFQLWTVVGACVKVRARASILTAMAWSVITVLYAMGTGFSPTPVGHAITMLMALWVCVRLWMVEAEPR